MKKNHNLMTMLLFFFTFTMILGASENVPVLSLDVKSQSSTNNFSELKYVPFSMLVSKNKDTSEFWRETEILSIIRSYEVNVDYDTCQKTMSNDTAVHFPSRRTLRTICRAQVDFQLCPQCPHFNNRTECELFRDSCKERKVLPSEYTTYCEQKYGKWRTMFIPADYSQCRCCDECIFYRELDQSCMDDEYNFDAEEFLPTTTIDFRAGCNPYWGHPEQEMKALRCDKVLRRCVPLTIPVLPKATLNLGIKRRSFRFEPPTDGADCPISCRGYACQGGLIREQDCVKGAYLPEKEQCNCCGYCSGYRQLNRKCAEYKNVVHNVNETTEIEVEEEFLEPGCDDGLVCRQGHCQDIHEVEASQDITRRQNEETSAPYEPCKIEIKQFKKKYGHEGHLHYNAPQCTPLWLYAPVQCRQFLCYCALEDGSRIEGFKVPRVDVSNMNCDCARERCRTRSDIECDGYGNYKHVSFTPYNSEEGAKLVHERAMEYTTVPAQELITRPIANVPASAKSATQ